MARYWFNADVSAASQRNTFPVFTDEALTVAATDLLSESGDAITVVTRDEDFQGPDGVTTLWGRVSNDTNVAPVRFDAIDAPPASTGGSQGALDHLSAQYQWTAVDPEYTTLDFAAATITGTPVVVGTGVTADAAAAPQLSLGTWLISTWCQIPGADADRYFEFSNNASDSLSSSAQWGKAGAMSGTPALLVVTEPLDLYLDVEHALGAAANVNFRLIAVKIA